MHRDHTVHVSADLSQIVQWSGHPDTRACPPTSSRLFPVPRWGMDVQTRRDNGDISRKAEARGSVTIEY